MFDWGCSWACEIGEHFSSLDWPTNFKSMDLGTTTMMCEILRRVDRVALAIFSDSLVSI